MHERFGEDRTCSCEDTLADRQTHTHTVHAHRNTPLFYRRRSSNVAAEVNITRAIRRVQEARCAGCWCRAVAWLSETASTKRLRARLAGWHGMVGHQVARSTDTDTGHYQTL